MIEGISQNKTNSENYIFLATVGSECYKKKKKKNVTEISYLYICLLMYLVIMSCITFFIIVPEPLVQRCYLRETQTTKR